MESKKGSGTIEVRPAATDNSIYDGEVPAPRRITQRIRDSVELRASSRSNSSASSEVRRSISVSCVTRLASENDCAKQRFIVWAAVKRNRSVRMAASDRLRCPLLRCGEHFGDHEAMLRHLSSCRHLEAGEYLCYECMRVEKFNDGRCKCCLGHQTKRRRIINAAKKVFSTLGHKSRKGGSFEVAQDDFTIPPPPSYESLDIEQELRLPIEPEISGNPVSEMDAEPAFPFELGSVNYEPQHDTLRAAGETDPFPPVVASFVAPQLPSHDLQSLQHSNTSRPSLTLDTHNTGRPSKVPRTKYLSPSSSLRSNNSSRGIISPVSAGSGAWTNGSTIETSLTSPITPFSSGVESSSLSRENSCKFPKDYVLPSSLSNWNTESDKANSFNNIGLATNGDYTLGFVPELPGDDPLDLALPRSWADDPSLFSFEPQENYSWPSTVDTTVNVLFTGDHDNSDMEREAFGTDTKTLVSHTWETIKEHTAFSMPNIRHVNNTLARQLENYSPKDILSRGLASLRNILGGVDSKDPLDYLCFIHVIYAFSVIIHEEEVATHINKLFKQALAYRGFLSPGDREAYSAVVTAIWEPRTSEEASSSLGRSSSLKGKDPELRTNANVPFQLDPLIVVAQNFLDDLEMSMLIGNSSVQCLEIVASELYSTHFAETGSSAQPTPNPFSLTVDFIIQLLSKDFSEMNDSLAPRLRAIGQKVASGYITSVRRLELELLQTGKATLPAPELFDDFIPRVRVHCGRIYEQTGSKPRAKYHELGVVLVESLSQNIDNPNVAVPNLDASTRAQEDPSNFAIDMPEVSDLSAEFWKDFDSSAFAGESLFENLGTSPEGTANITTNSMARVGGLTMTASTATHHTTVDPASLSRTGSDTESTVQAEKKRPVYTPDYVPPSNMPAIAPTPSSSHTDEPTSSTPAEGEALGPRTEANDCCEICGYRPKGDPQWFKGSMAKHKKLQHSTEPPKIYRCPYPGCTSAYKNRPDNLRQHQIEKGHFVDGEGKQKRSGKRKKMEDD
ncbi:hypothetical protein SUNI508_04710 [Seiridium unicorne]|uniref:C2H2-type domain-containing protein n=1 Tax=Seiridium unicorne TaxID=138068 RepID=A0ABR2V712_9PEZI